MATQMVSCPTCRSSLAIQQHLPAKARCPRCAGQFNIGVDGSTALLTDVAMPPSFANRLPIIGVILGGSFLFVLLGGSLLAVCLFVGQAQLETDNDEAPLVDKSALKPQPLEPVCFVKPGPKKGAGPVASIPGGKPSGDAPAGEAKAICSEAALPANQKEINAAIDKGVAYLKAGLSNDGRFQSDAQGNRLGGSALIGLTLLSCGVPAEDPKVAGIVARVRAEGPQCSQTYDLATCIWLLDKLGDASDRELIRKMALRLMAGQLPSGGWHYTCQLLQPADEMELLRVLEERPYVSLPTGVPAGDKTDKPAKDAPRDPGGKPTPGPGDRVKNLPVVKFEPGAKVATAGGDNSNTQFAVLALWVAQKHGVPAQRSLAMVEAHFLQTQGGDGTWGYSTPNHLPDSMTCAGLIGLAVGHGLAQPKSAGPRPDDKNLAKDPKIEKALVYLGKRLPELKCVLNPQELQKAKSELAGIGPKLKTAKGEEHTQLLKRQKELQQVVSQTVKSLGELYFMWSLERVAVIYGLRTIGGTDWYAWGAEILLVRQEANGSWRAGHTNAVDSCFALLFLKRVNVAGDLTKVLQGLGGARDPGAPPGTQSHISYDSQSEIKDEPDVAPGRVKTRTGYKTPAKTS
jgi:hypothetical protein